MDGWGNYVFVNDSKFKFPDVRGSELSSKEASDTGAEPVGATVE